MGMLAAKINPKVAKQLSALEVPGQLEKPSNYHITMFYFEDDPSINDVADLIIPLFEKLEAQNTIRVILNKVSQFPAGEDGYPIIVPVVSPELKKLRQEIARIFDENEIDFSKLHPDYKPHITLSYSDKPIKDKWFEEIEFEVDEICYYGGKKR